MCMRDIDSMVLLCIVSFFNFALHLCDAAQQRTLYRFYSSFAFSTVKTWENVVLLLTKDFKILELFFASGIAD